MEIYMFVDPLSPECWALEPAIKKLKIRYGRFFHTKDHRRMQHHSAERSET